MAPNNKAILISVSLLMSSAFAVCSSADISCRWREWKGEHQRAYKSAEEESMRFSVFRERLLEIEILSRENPDATFKLNRFSDLTKSEFKSRYLTQAFVSENNRRGVKTAPPSVRTTSLPINWTSPFLTPVRNQAQCGSCASFAATGAVEAAFHQANGFILQFSPQQLMDCATGSSGCNGAWPDVLLQWAKTTSASRGRALETETDYPYSALTSTSCNADYSAAVANVTDVTRVIFNEATMDQELFSRGPMTITLDASTIQFYSGGVLSNSTQCEITINHAVLLSGWGEDASGKYWVVKNSWGDWWGEKGYFRIRRGVGACFMTRLAATAVKVGKCSPSPMVCTKPCGTIYDGCGQKFVCGSCEAGKTCTDIGCTANAFTNPSISPALGSYTVLSRSVPFANIYLFTTGGRPESGEQRKSQCMLHYSFISNFGDAWTDILTKNLTFQGADISNTTRDIWYQQIAITDDTKVLEVTGYCTFNGTTFWVNNPNKVNAKFQLEVKPVINYVQPRDAVLGVVQTVSSSSPTAIFYIKVKAIPNTGRLGSRPVPGLYCYTHYSYLNSFGEAWSGYQESSMTYFGTLASDSSVDVFQASIPMYLDGKVLESAAYCTAPGNTSPVWVSTAGSNYKFQISN